MIKSRCTYLCNLKLLLIVSVVLGHSLEQINAQESMVYRLIYLFHKSRTGAHRGDSLCVDPGDNCAGRAAGRVFVHEADSAFLAFVVSAFALSLGADGSGNPPLAGEAHLRRCFAAFDFDGMFPALRCAAPREVPVPFPDGLFLSLCDAGHFVPGEAAGGAYGQG